MCNVNIATGEVTQYETDFFLPGIIPLHFIRSYSSSSPGPGPLGYGWKHNHQVGLRVSADEALLVYYSEVPISLPLSPGDTVVLTTPSALKVTRTASEIVVMEADRKKLFFARPRHLDQLWPLVRKEDSFGNAIRFAYDSSERLTNFTDTAGRVLTFYYDSRERLIEISLELSRERCGRVSLMKYEYDMAGDLIGATDRTGVPCTYSYQDHLLVSVTNRIGGHLYYQYDQDRRCIRTWREDGIQYREIRHHPARTTAAVIDSRGRTTLYRNNEKGLTQEEVDFLGLVTKDVYDSNGNLLLNNNPSGSLQEVLTRDTANNVVRLATNAGEIRFQMNDMGQPVSITNAEGQTSLYEYDKGGNLLRSVSPEGAEWRFSYDERGRAVSTVNPLGYEVHHSRTESPPTLTDTDYLGVVSMRTFDVFGNMIAFENWRGHRTEIKYNPSGRPIKIIYPDLSTEFYTYDPEGNRRSFTDGTGLTTRYEYNLNSSLIAIIDPHNQRISFEYDNEENLTAIINTRGQRAEFVYDALGRQTKTVYFGGYVEYYDYDDHDRMIRIRTGDGAPVVALIYDEANRLAGKKWADGKQILIEYGAQNQIISLIGDDVDLAYEWDADMRIVKERIGNTTLEFEYDLASNRIALRTSKGRQIRYDWDLRGRLIKITDSGSHVYQYTYNLSDCITEARLPSGLVQKFEYDALDRMILRSVAKPDAAEITRRQFQYDGASRLSRMLDARVGSFEYRYDTQDHVEKVIKDRVLVERYQYDGEDNLLVTREGVPILVDSSGQVVGAGSIEYHNDEFGNRILKREGAEEVRYDYGLDGLLRRARDNRGNTLEFQYDPTGRRVAKVQNGVRTDFLWDGVSLLEETTESHGSIEYLFMPGSFIPAGQTQAEEHYSYSIDQLGTPNELFDSRGEIAWAVEYTIFGHVARVLQSRVASPFRFQGQYWDEELGLSYNRNRYYDPRLGRFTSADPIRFTGGPNPYRYVINPLNWVDPLGLAPCVLRPKCSWSKKQQEDYSRKAQQWQRRARNEGSIAKVPCEDRKVAKDIYNDCRDNKGYADKLPPLIETSSKCSNQQADHKKEVVAGGGETDCNNLQPINESVNKSIGATIGKCLEKGPITSITIITSMVPGKKTGCRPGGKKCPDL